MDISSLHIAEALSSTRSTGYANRSLKYMENGSVKCHRRYHFIFKHDYRQADQSLVISPWLSGGSLLTILPVRSLTRRLSLLSAECI